MRKIIFVAFYGGRCGSSLVTGLLNFTEASIGNVCNAKSCENPRGFLEIKELNDFFARAYYPQLGPCITPLSFDLLREMATAKRDIALAMINKSFGSEPVIAFKVMSYMPIPMFENDKNIEVKVLCLRRNITDQVRSIEKMWGKKTLGTKKFTEWLIVCYRWVERFKKEFKFECLNVDFDTMLNNPIYEANRIYDFCELKHRPGDHVISEWVNPAFARSRSK